MQDLRSFAWSMSQSPLPGMPAAAFQGSRRVCESCGRGAYKGRTTCAKCLTAQQHRRAGVCGSCGGVTYKGKLTCAKCERPARSQYVACWICGKRIKDRPRAEGRQPTCRPCTRVHGAGVCTGCGGPMRLAGSSAPPERRRCRDCQRVCLTERICELCEKPYIPKHGQQRFCSVAHANAWNGGHRPPFTGITDRATRKQAQSRARRLRQAQTWDGISDEEILERDGWRCQIPGCKRRPIRKDARYPHPRSKSIDHIVPLSLGGDDTAVNKRAAHLGCNQARGNQVGFEQTALFGVIREPPLATVTAGERAAPREKRLCKCGNVPVNGHKFCQGCIDRRRAVAEENRWRSTVRKVHYYTCRYCGELRTARRPREVCPARPCQLGRLAANNLIARKGMAPAEAHARVAALVRAQQPRRWSRNAA